MMSGEANAGVDMVIGTLRRVWNLAITPIVIVIVIVASDGAQ